jgi:hypothetical protein
MIRVAGIGRNVPDCRDFEIHGGICLQRETIPPSQSIRNEQFRIAWLRDQLLRG